MIEPFDVASLCASPRNGWYPVDAEDLKQSAWKVGATAEEIDDMLQRSGFYTFQQSSVSISSPRAIDAEF